MEDEDKAFKPTIQSDVLKSVPTLIHCPVSDSDCPGAKLLSDTSTWEQLLTSTN